MKLYEVTTLSIQLTATSATHAALEKHLPDAGGRLLGVWTADVGVLNRIYVLRGFASHDELHDARERLLRSADPLGCGAGLDRLESNAYAPFPFLPPIEPAVHGRCYELRTYGLKHGLLPQTIEAWRQAVPGRTELSPLIGAMYALDGDLTRFLNIWAYPSANDRAGVRADAFAKGVWPPVGGPTSLTHMSSTLATPAAYSPLK